MDGSESVNKRKRWIPADWRERRIHSTTHATGPFAGTTVALHQPDTGHRIVSTVLVDSNM
eukprot:5865131-Amphidinium_carterae.2